MLFSRLTDWFLEKPRYVKRLISLASDGCMVIAALWLSFSLRLGYLYVPEERVISLFIVAPLLAFPVFIKLGLYRAIIRYIGQHALWAVIRAVTLYSLLLAFFVVLVRLDGVPRSVYFINWMLCLLMIGGGRMAARWVFTDPFMSLSKQFDKSHNVLIYGAGSSGAQLAALLAYEPDMRVVGFIDDSPSLHGQHIQGVRVYDLTALNGLIEGGVTDVLLAMPSVSRSRRNEIIAFLEPFSVHVKTLPSMIELAQGKINIEDIRDVEIEDLLGRDAVSPRTDLLEANIKGKVVMVTGAGGSIGSELCRQIMRLRPRLLVLFENNEYALYAIDKELSGMASSVSSRETLVPVPVLGSVNSLDRLTKTCVGLGVQTIYHAAAYKHVPMVEKNPGAAIRNNTFGTLNAAQAAIHASVEMFVLVSTDKAVRPTNTMGATKRLAELVLQALSQESSKTRFCMVRFGNVLGSSGSVVPLFREQIKRGGPVTVTHPEITRYFMTIPEAAELVIQAGAMGQGGDVFVLDMGEPVKILDLAKRMIHLSGMEILDDEHPDGDISISFTSLRPGEKLYEELLIGGNVALTVHPKIMRAEEEVLSWKLLSVLLGELDQALELDNFERVRILLGQAVSGFKPQCGIKDVVTQNHRQSVPEISTLSVH